MEEPIQPAQQPQPVQTPPTQPSQPAQPTSPTTPSQTPTAQPSQPAQPASPTTTPPAQEPTKQPKKPIIIIGIIVIIAIGIVIAFTFIAKEEPKQLKTQPPISPVTQQTPVQENKTPVQENKTPEKNTTTQAPPKGTPETVEGLTGGAIAYKNVTYSTEGGKPILLDLFVPANAQAKLPLVIWIHGGAWKIGTRTDCFGKKLLKNGYAVACIDYRLSDEAIFPAQIYDVKGAVRWLRKNADTYKLDEKNFGAWGDSAGGHLSALLGVSGDVKELEGKANTGYSSKVKAVVDWFGPTDFLKVTPKWFETLPQGELMPYELYYDGALDVIGQPPNTPLDKTNLLVKQINPITHVTKDDPPILIMHGDKDDVVPINQSKLLYDALKSAGVDVTFQVVKDGGHWPGFGEEQVKQFVLPFLDKHLKPVL
jgi:acetyl esterase/lipase